MLSRFPFFLFVGVMNTRGWSSAFQCDAGQENRPRIDRERLFKEVMFSLAEQIELPGVRVRCNLCVLVSIEKSKPMSSTDTWPLANYTNVFNRHEASGQSHRQAMPARVLCPMNSQAHVGQCQHASVFFINKDSVIRIPNQTGDKQSRAQPPSLIPAFLDTVSDIKRCRLVSSQVMSLTR